MPLIVAKVQGTLFTLLEEEHQKNLTVHRLPPLYRAFGLVFPAIIALIAAYMVPIFLAADLPLWPAFILGLPAVIAVLICVDFFGMTIGFDAAGVHYRAVGYRLFAPWPGLSFHRKEGKAFLQVTHGERHWAPWLGAMYAVLTVLQPPRTRHVNHLITSIPLHLFATSETDAVFKDLRAMAPEGFAEENATGPQNGARYHRPT